LAKSDRSRAEGNGVKESNLAGADLAQTVKSIFQATEPGQYHLHERIGMTLKATAWEFITVNGGSTRSSGWYCPRHGETSRFAGGFQKNRPSG